MEPEAAWLDPRIRGKLAALQRRVVACTACPRLVEYRERVAVEKKPRYAAWEYWGRPVPSHGDPHGRALLVGDAALQLARPVPRLDLDEHEVLGADPDEIPLPEASCRPGDAVACGLKDRPAPAFIPAPLGFGVHVPS